MLTTPEGIRTLQRKLYRKARQELACRFHALHDKIYRADILGHAYNLVRANKGSAGIEAAADPSSEAVQGQGLEKRLYTYSAARSLSAPWAFQGAGDSWLEEGACPAMRNIGKPCAGKPHARFDERGLVKTAKVRLLRHRQTKGAGNR